MLLFWIFISSYTTIYFFVKKFTFSNFSISVNTIFECSSLISKLMITYTVYSWSRNHKIVEK